VRSAGGDATMQIVFIDTFILSEGYTRNLIKQKIAFGELHPGGRSKKTLSLYIFAVQCTHACICKYMQKMAFGKGGF
jgi:hypothetical protein